MHFQIHILTIFRSIDSSASNASTAVASFGTRQLADAAVRLLEKQNTFEKQSGVLHIITKMYDV